MCGDYEIRSLPLSLKSNRDKIERFLSANGLRIDKIDYYAVISSLDDDEIIAGGGLCGDVIKCVAVNDDLREDGLSSKLISHLISTAMSNGYESVKVFTKPKNKIIFESLGFNIIAETDNAIFLENGQKGIKSYCKYLSCLRKKGTSGSIVINGNPFTKGHRYLIEQSSKQVDNLYVISVSEDISLFSYNERKEMLQSGCSDLHNVIVCEGSEYTISQNVFPTYFLKEINSATDTQIELDLDIFVRHIAPALNISIRFVGSETKDKTTKRYNEMMSEMLPEKGIDVIEIERLSVYDTVISASLLRKHIADGSFYEASKLACNSAIPYIISRFATNALEKELDTTPKPGLVDKKDNGAHKDMDYELMQKSILALHPLFTEFALMGYRESLPSLSDMIEKGLKAEKAMFEITSGVNTHKGALFSLGIVIIAASHIHYKYGNIKKENLRKCISALANLFPDAKNTHGDDVARQYKVQGAVANAREGYKTLFEDWLPFINSVNDEYAMHKTLLRIMTTLDDTNVYYRRGSDMSKQVKLKAARLLNDFSVKSLEQMNVDFIKENVSPGGCADMLSLTIFINSILS